MRALLLGLALLAAWAQDGADSPQDQPKVKPPDTYLAPNPAADKNLFGRLKKASKDSRLTNMDEQMADEEKREIIKTLFEGQGSQNNRIITQQKPSQASGSAQGASGAPSTLSSGYYDRLSRSNLRGYSPQLQTLQSALNQRRAPGAPKLIETGKLDYETLSYPAYSIRHDIRILEMKMRLSKNYAWAKALGLERRYLPEQLLDSVIEAQLQAQAAAKGIKESPRQAKRQSALENAASALREFEAAAQPAQDPEKITRSLVIALGAKQKEAARWIALASLQEELERLDQERDFLTPELLDLIGRLPLGAADLSAYKRRGADLKEKLSALKARDELAIRLLESESWLSDLSRADALIARNSGLGQALGRAASDYAAVPYRLAGAIKPKLRWRELADNFIMRFLPGSARARALKREEALKEKLKDVFLKIASGDLNAAHAILASL
ncbi:MAG: hypothetical protein HY921_12615 [Elusimicrobia bacterium]|nr:hypothetical protein [Elusimicrobiota bacterium]